MLTLPPTHTSPPLPSTSTYIYTLLPISPTTLLTIDSTSTLHFLSPQTLIPSTSIPQIHTSITCLSPANDTSSSLFLTAGRDGIVKYWDVRTNTCVQSVTNHSEFKREIADRNLLANPLISTLHSAHHSHFLATGTENPTDGPSESPIYIFDTRNLSAPTLTLPESHTDTITSLSLSQPTDSRPSYLLSSSTDGLCSLFDTKQSNEDDALFQVINHGSAVAQAVFSKDGKGGEDVFVLGTDETLSMHPIHSNDDDVPEPAPRVWGDVRERFGCEYVVKILDVGGELVVAAGNHGEGWLDLIPVSRGSATTPLDYGFGTEGEGRVRLRGAHGEEIVRDVGFGFGGDSNICYTCGEDGLVRAWTNPNGTAGASMEVNEEVATAKMSSREKKERKEKRREKKEKRKEGGERYKPY
ncbi:WD40-repeat-containing domain protein [Dendryphion nanum]|uniref:WD40-repeat-containing domain protein n=1 Tax=Dendryphion nanum TaxID=256645 RepID=A0A9P9ECZ2_9PLEO|nr:WD40-repeat-containing domain protein [Dendryphion nanum]